MRSLPYTLIRQYFSDSRTVRFICHRLSQILFCANAPARGAMKLPRAGGFDNLSFFSPYRDQYYSANKG